jgi:multidrug efflux pump
MFARFFIDRPIFAWVISIVITLVGGVAVFLLPIDLYPPITPPTISVTAVYPGASAEVVANTVASPIEQQVNGVERMLYMSSQSTNDGSYALTVTFEIGTDLNAAQVLVQNRVQLAMPLLPEQVQIQGVSTRKRLPNILLGVNLTSPDGRYDAVYLSNYATIHVLDELLRIDGVGDVTSLGQRAYAMRIWLDPEKLAARNLTAVDVVNAIRSQNVQVAAGAVGQQPVPPGQDLELPITTLGRLETVEQFGDMIIKTGHTGPTSPVVRVRDVGRIELGAQSYEQITRLDGQPTALLGVFQLPGSNALDVADAVRKRMDELEQGFPEGLKYSINYDTTPFIRQSVDEVFRTLFIAVLLVAAVVLFFLQDWKAMILPMIDVPVSLIGTFAVMAAAGFSLNNLTLFGLVLAIGIVVDDAIVVLENIERLIATGLDARTATIKAMDEITGPIIAITLVLSSVFLPSVFITGLNGQFYRQFAITISVSMIISAVNALTLTPARAVFIFKTEERKDEGGRRKEEAESAPHPSSLPPHPSREALPWWIFAVFGGALTVWLGQTFLGWQDRPNLSNWEAWGVDTVYFLPGALVGGVIGWLIIGIVNRVLGWIFRVFNRLFDRVTELYGWTVGMLLRLSGIVLVAYCGLLFLTWWTISHTPTGFLPTQDQGYLLVSAQLPDSASVQRTEAVMNEIGDIARALPGVAHTVGISGTSFLLTTNGSNLGSMFVVLKPFDERQDPEQYDAAIADKIQRLCYQKIEDAMIGVFRPPPIRGIGNVGGFQLQVQQRGTVDFDALERSTNELVRKANADPKFAGVLTLFRAHTPQLYLDIDRTKVQSLDVPLQDVFTTLQVFMGGLYVNQFNLFGRTWQVQVEADAPFRTQPDIIRQFQVRNTEGQMVPLGSVAKVEDKTGPISVMRYNMYTSAAINGNPAPGVSSGQIIQRVTQLAHEVGVDFEWTGTTYLEVVAGNVAFLVFGFGTIVVYLVLAAKYESWGLPLAVILVVPLCLLASAVGMNLAHLPVDIFVQIGFLVLIGLASKNAILIVEFARQLEHQGRPLLDATLEASRLRFRPIVMTSFAFIFGVLPLVISQGAGKEMRQSLGIAVFSGMIGVTLFGVFLTPVFLYAIRRLGERRSKPGAQRSIVPSTPPSSMQVGAS